MKPLPFLSSDPARRPGRPAIIVPVQSGEPDELRRECEAVATTGVVDVIEWRIDPLIAGVKGGTRPTGAMPVIAVTGEELIAQGHLLNDVEIGSVRFGQLGVAVADAAPFRSISWCLSRSTWPSL